MAQDTIHGVTSAPVPREPPRAEAMHAADVRRTLVVSAAAVSTAADGTRSTSHAAHAKVQVKGTAAATLAFTGAGPVGAVTATALVVVLALLLLLGGGLLVRRRARRG